jgi:hypothetical protein
MQTGCYLQLKPEGAVFTLNVTKIFKEKTDRQDRRKVIVVVGPSHIFGVLKFSMGALST